MHEKAVERQRTIDRQLSEERLKKDPRSPGIHVQEPDTDKEIAASSTKQSPLKSMKEGLGSFIKSKIGKSPKKEETLNLTGKKSENTENVIGDFSQTGGQSNQQF